MQMNGQLSDFFFFRKHYLFENKICSGQNLNGLIFYGSNQMHLKTKKFVEGKQSDLI